MSRPDRSLSLRARLLLGVGFAVVVPFVLFAWVGSAGLRRKQTESLGKHLLDSMAWSLAQGATDWLANARSKAVTFCATSEVLRMFERGADGVVDEAFASFASRVSELYGDLGDLVLVSADRRVLFLLRDGRPQVGARGQRLVDARWQRLLAASVDGPLRVLPPTSDPLAEQGVVETSFDPEQYVLPLVVPMRDDTQVALGKCFFLLPLADLQDRIDHTAERLVEDADVRSAEVWVVDRASGRNLLHTDRKQIAGPAELPNVEGFTIEPAANKVRAARRIENVLGLEWSAGVRADAGEVFRSVDSLSHYFLGLVALVLLTSLGIAAWISVAATRSLGQLEHVTEAFGAGNLATRAEVRGPREVRKLAGALNEMATQLEVDRERRKVAERDRAWTKIARQVAHEIKNPLQPVRLHGELIQRMMAREPFGPVERQRAGASVEVILRQVDALQRIVADFSAYALASQPIQERTQFRASAVLAELVALYSAGGADGVLVDFRDESGTATLDGSALRLQQVLVNLIKNAIEATAESQVEVVATTSDQEWVCEVRDRGHGLSEDDAARAFEPSFSTKPGGTGLGLAICRRNIDAMGGHLTLEPRPGGGATARVRLPLSRK